MNRLQPVSPVFCADLLPTAVQGGSPSELKHAPDLLRGYGPLGVMRAQPGASAAWASAHLMASVARR